MVVDLTRDEIELLMHALDSHVAWIKDDNDDPDSEYDDEDIDKARELEDKLLGFALL